MAGLSPGSGKSIQWTNSRVAVGGLREPYYLEGPNSRKDSDWGWLRGLNLGGGLVGSLGGFSKREIKALDSTEIKAADVEVQPGSNTTII
ncbi:hypothetical protein ABW21_db0201290 [Orbilia brochopaga]|nr:hypothetical protein ABW21_db0201290 [Drechslerella brochopaga]